MITTPAMASLTSAMLTLCCIFSLVGRSTTHERKFIRRLLLNTSPPGRHMIVHVWVNDELERILQASLVHSNAILLLRIRAHKKGSLIKRVTVVPPFDVLRWDGMNTTYQSKRKRPPLPLHTAALDGIIPRPKNTVLSRERLQWMNLPSF